MAKNQKPNRTETKDLLAPEQELAKKKMQKIKGGVATRIMTCGAPGCSGVRNGSCGCKKVNMQDFARIN